jgi:hypothetical protein
MNLSPRHVMVMDAAFVSQRMFAPYFAKEIAALVAAGVIQQVGDRYGLTDYGCVLFTVAMHQPAISLKTCNEGEVS